MSADMMTQSVGAPQQVPPPVVSTAEKPAARQEAAASQPAQQQPEVSLQESQEELKQKVEDAASQLNEVMAAFGKKLHFQVHEGTDRTYVEVVDKATDRVIKEFPAKDLLDTVARFHDVIGMILDTEG